MKSIILKKLARELKVNNISESLYFPQFFELETVNACNAKCNICTIPNWKRRNSYLMPQRTWEKFLNEMKYFSSWIDRVNVSRDGEPLLDLDLERKIKDLKNNSIRFVTLATNASLLNPQRARSILNSGLDDIMFSIDGFTQETYEKIRVGLKFNEVVQNCLNFIKLRDAEKYKTSIRIRMVLQDENKDELERWFQYWAQFLKKGDRVYAKPAHSWGNQLKTYQKITKKIVKRDYSQVACISPWSTMVVKVNGDVPLCPMDFKCTRRMGNINESSIRKIWNSDGLTLIRNRLMSGKRNSIALCRNCYLWDKDTIIENRKLYCNANDGEPADEN